MQDAASPLWADAHPRELLRRHGLRPRKAWGQNFLVGRDALDRVAAAAALRPTDVVLEIGTGLGRLTVRLADQAAHVVTVEIDESLAAVAAGHLRDGPNVTLLQCDFLEGKHRISPRVTQAATACSAGPHRPLRLVGNLPYGISSPALVNALEWEVPVNDMCVMLQKEVAARLAASPGTPEYGPLTVFVDYWATVEKVFDLPPSAFWPRPEVASTLMRVMRRPHRVRSEDYARFATAVRRIFMGRRKTLAAALRNAWGRPAAEAVLLATGLDPATRVDRLTTDQFEAMAATLPLPPSD